MFKYHIAIPVPLGSTIYEYSTECCNACYIQKEHRAYVKTLPNTRDLGCSKKAPCHTQFLGVREMTFTLDNIKYVLDHWGDTLFATYDEAFQIGKELTAAHIKEMRDMGYAVADNGKIEPAVVKEYKKRRHQDD